MLPNLVSHATKNRFQTVYVIALKFQLVTVDCSPRPAQILQLRQQFRKIVVTRGQSLNHRDQFSLLAFLPRQSSRLSIGSQQFRNDRFWRTATFTFELIAPHTAGRSIKNSSSEQPHMRHRQEQYDLNIPCINKGRNTE